MEKEKIKYEYLLKAWGGAIQELGLEDQLSYQWFNSREERNKEQTRIENLVKTTKSGGIAFSTNEGHLTRFKFTIKSLVLYKEEFHWVYNELGYGFFNEQELIDNNQDYLLQWKWGISPPDGVDLDEAELLNTSLIIEEPNE